MSASAIYRRKCDMFGVYGKAPSTNFFVPISGFGYSTLDVSIEGSAPELKLSSGGTASYLNVLASY